MAHPVTGERVVAFVTYGRVKLTNLRARPQITVTFRSGWQWAAVEGRAEIVGPDDPQPGFDAERLRLLLREVFVAAGGTHDDWAEYDRVMLAQRRTAVFVAVGQRVQRTQVSGRVSGAPARTVTLRPAPAFGARGPGSVMMRP